MIRFNELRETLQLRLSGEFKRFADEELRAVLTLLAGAGVVWELAFGSWVLLQPERINADAQAVETSSSRREEARTRHVFRKRFEPRDLGCYMQAVIRTLQADEHQRGYLMEVRWPQADSPSAIPAGDWVCRKLRCQHAELLGNYLVDESRPKGDVPALQSYQQRPSRIGIPGAGLPGRARNLPSERGASVAPVHQSAAFGAGLASQPVAGGFNPAESAFAPGDPLVARGMTGGGSCGKRRSLLAHDRERRKADSAGQLLTLGIPAHAGLPALHCESATRQFAGREIPRVEGGGTERPFNHCFG